MVICQLNLYYYLMDVTVVVVVVVVAVVKAVSYFIECQILF